MRGGGHNFAGNAVCEGGLMIDLTPMKGIRVDPAARRARAQGGVTWREFDRECQVFGLATTGGTISSTGHRRPDARRRVRLARPHPRPVLRQPDLGRRRAWPTAASSRPAQNENADLFWGLRGGGGNFGVVTSFEYRLHPVGQVLGGMLVYPVERAKEVLRTVRDLCVTLPDELPGDRSAPDDARRRPGAGGARLPRWPRRGGRGGLPPLRDQTAPMADLVGPMTYEQIQTQLDEGFPFGLQNYGSPSS